MNLRTMFYRVLLMGMVTGLVTGVQAQDEAQSETGKKHALDYNVKSIDGQQVDLSKYMGKVVVVVNTASKCGLTRQYAGLQKLYDQHAEEGLVILGFPCNQFGRQEPGTEPEIKAFCAENYGVAFPMFSKIDVKGEAQAPFYKNLCQLDLQPKGSGQVNWNFEKFVIDRKGQPVARFKPQTKPNDPEFQKVIKSALAK